MAKTEAPEEPGEVQNVIRVSTAAPAASGISPHTTFLFPLPSILYGLGRVLDLGGQLDSYNTSLSPQQADIIALANDWLAASQDVREAAISYIVDHLRDFLNSHEGRAFLQEQLDQLAIAIRR